MSADNLEPQASENTTAPSTQAAGESKRAVISNGPVQSPQRDNAQTLLIVLVVLALLASVIMLFTGSIGALKIALLAALWAAVIGAFLAFRYRNQIETTRSELDNERKQHSVEMKEAQARFDADQAKLERDITEKVQAKIRSEENETLAEIRLQLDQMREQLEYLTGQSFAEPSMLRAEARRIQELESESTRKNFTAKSQEPETVIPEPVLPASNNPQPVPSSHKEPQAPVFGASKKPAATEDKKSPADAKNKPTSSKQESEKSKDSAKDKATTQEATRSENNAKEKTTKDSASAKDSISSKESTNAKSYATPSSKFKETVAKKKSDSPAQNEETRQFGRVDAAEDQATVGRRRKPEPEKDQAQAPKEEKKAQDPSSFDTGTFNKVQWVQGGTAKRTTGEQKPQESYVGKRSAEAKAAEGTHGKRRRDERSQAISVADLLKRKKKDS